MYGSLLMPHQENNSECEKLSDVFTLLYTHLACYTLKSIVLQNYFNQNKQNNINLMQKYKYINSKPFLFKEMRICCNKNKTFVFYIFLEWQQPASIEFMKLSFMFFMLKLIHSFYSLFLREKLFWFLKNKKHKSSRIISLSVIFSLVLTTLLF